MAVGASARIAAALAAATLVVSGCGNDRLTHTSIAGPVSGGPSATHSVAVTTGSPSPAPSHQASRPSRDDVDSAAATVRQYLHAWAVEGPARASRYLVAGQRVARDQGSPRISAGRVTSYRLLTWDGPRQFTLLVSLDLTFTTDPSGWNRGENDRFVTAHRVGGHHRFLLEFATSP